MGEKSFPSLISGSYFLNFPKMLLKFNLRGRKELVSECFTGTQEFKEIIV